MSSNLKNRSGPKFSIDETVRPSRKGLDMYSWITATDRFTVTAIEYSERYGRYEYEVEPLNVALEESALAPIN